jgi:hypothetical protein
VIVGQKRRITPRLTHGQAEPRFQALFCTRTGEMSGAPLALPGLWPLLTHDLILLIYWVVLRGVADRPVALAGL